MKLSKMHLRTLREASKEAELESHQLLIRANMIRKEAAGVYTFMPLGWKVVRKIEDIVRDEQDRIGAEELHMPATQPAELWQESGRWYAYGPELWRIQDRNNRDFCLAPTCEEMITNIVKTELFADINASGIFLNYVYQLYYEEHHLLNIILRRR